MKWIFNIIYQKLLHTIGTLVNQPQAPLRLTWLQLITLHGQALGKPLFKFVVDNERSRTERGLIIVKRRQDHWEWLWQLSQDVTSCSVFHDVEEEVVTAHHTASE